MTTEQLRLEIEVAAKEALKNLSATSDEYKRLAKEAKAAVPPANEFKDTMARLQADLKKNETAAKLFGDQLGGLKERQALLRGAMVDLIDKGIAPEVQEMQDLKREYDATAIASKEVENQTRVMSGSFSDLQGSIGAIAAVKVFQTVATGVLDAGQAAITTAGNYEMLQANFETLTGSTAAAAAEFKGLKQFANVTPFNLEGVAKNAQQLQAAKVPIADLTTRLGQLGDLSLGNSQKFDSMVSAFSKMSVKGKVDLEQLNIVMESGVPILDELAKGFGVTGEEVFTMLSKGEVKTTDFIAAMERMTSEGGQFFGGMARGAQTWNGVWSTYKDSLDGVAASFGELLLPAAKVVVGILTNLNNAIAESPLLKGIFAGVLVAATVLLGVWAVKMAAATAATWLHYAATMALNAAKALGNPILLAGIAAVGLATAGYVLYASSQNKAAEATRSSTTATTSSAVSMRDVAAATKAAEEATKAYQHELDITTIKELEAMKASMEFLKTQASQAGMNGWTKEMEANLQAVGKEIEEKKKAFEDLTKKAEEFKKSWAKTYGESLASRSSDPYASIDFEQQQKLGEAAAAGIGEKNKKVIDEINAYYLAKRADLTQKIAADEQALMAKLSATKIDDLELEKTAQLASLKELETKSVASAIRTGTDVSTIHERYAAARASIEEKYAKEISETQKAEAKAAAEAAWDLANKSAVISAQFTETKVDDLKLQAEKELALFEGTESEKKALAEKYAKEIADAQIAEDERVYKERLAAMKAAGNYGGYAASVAGKAASSAVTNDSSELGAAAKGFASGGMFDALGSVVMKVVGEIWELFTSIENVKKVMNPVMTILTSVKDILEPVINDTLQPLVTVLEMVGSVIATALTPIFLLLGNILTPICDLLEPIIAIIQSVVQIISSLLYAFSALNPVTMLLQAGLELLGDAFTWFNDSVLVPFGNGMIDIINGIITWANKYLGTKIATLQHLKTTAEIADREAAIAAQLELVSDAMSEVKEIFSKKKDELKDAYNKNLSSLKNLLELGALSEADYASRVSSVNTDYNTALETLETAEEAQLNALEELKTAIQKGYLTTADVQAAITAALAAAASDSPTTVATSGGFINGENKGATDIGDIPIWIERSYAVGTPEITEDQVAKVHKGEAIIPSSFAQGLRDGTLSIGKGSSSSTNVFQTTVTVEGSVTTENALADSVANKITRRAKRGQYEAG